VSESTSTTLELTQKIKLKSTFCETLKLELGKAVIGQEEMLDRLLVGLLADGHILLEGLPGLAKTTAVKAFSDALSLDFKRIQFTPDLLPSDLLGNQIYNMAQSSFEIKKGPLFTQVVLADEINRAPSKVQTALLEAMQEKQITIGQETFKLTEPYLVLATQNPIEQEGTYPLPEAQVDRFMLKVLVKYPTAEEEMKILEAVSGTGFETVNSIITIKEIIESRNLIKEIYLDEKLKKYIVKLVGASRDPKEYGLDDLEGLIEIGASPRASIDLAKAAKAVAFIAGRGYVTPEDIKNIGMDVLRHRIGLSYEAEAEEMAVEDVINKIFNGVEVP
jgi:MoxR-like ATPase